MRFISIISLLFILVNLTCSAASPKKTQKAPVSSSEEQVPASGTEEVAPPEQIAPQQSALPGASDAANSCRFSSPISEGAPFKGGNSSSYDGTYLFTECQKMAKSKWEDVTANAKDENNLRRQFEATPGGDYIAFINAKNKLARRFNGEISQLNNRGSVSSGPAKVCEERALGAKDQLERAVSDINEVRSNLIKCLALATMTTEVDFKDTDHTSKNETASADGKLKCVTDGAETQDYPACKHFVYLYTGFLVGQKGLETVQTVNYSSNNLERQEDLMRTATGTIKKTMQMQRDSLEDQKKMADTNTAFHGAKGASLFAAYKRIPDQGDFKAKCKSIINEAMITKINNDAKKALLDLYKNVQIENNNGINYSTMISQQNFESEGEGHPCDEVLNSAHVFMNGKAKQVMMEMFMQAGVDTLANFGKSMILDKQVGMMDRAIGDINDYTASITIPTFATASATADYCAMYPNDVSCSEIVNNRRYDLGVGGITIGGSGMQSTGNLANDAASGSITSSGGIGSGPGGVVGSTGVPISDTARGSGFVDTVAAASMKDGMGAGNPGGGGGGGAGSVSPPNSGGGGGGEGGGSSGPAVGAKGAAYFGGGNHSYSGGIGSGAKKKPGEANPLDGLFKNQGPKTGGDVLDFRGVASINDKEKDLFKLISNRYDTVSKSKRLIEYEVVPKKD